MLKIRNEATTITTPARTSRMIGRNESCFLMSSVLRLAAWSPVSVSSERGTTDATEERSAAGETPGSAWTEIWSSLPRRPPATRAAASVTVAELEPPPVVSPSLEKPTMRKWRRRSGPTTPIVSPRCRLARSAVLLSSISSRGPRGWRPFTTVWASNGSGTSEKRKLGANGVPSLSPLAFTRRTCVATPPAALRTPGTRRTRSR